jgi:hypothetical protein
MNIDADWHEITASNMNALSKKFTPSTSLFRTEGDLKSRI